MTSQTVHVYQRSVHFSETDAAGVAHFSRLAAYIEEAEHDFFHACGVPAIGPDFGWPRIRMEINYRSPCAFGNLLEIRLSHPVFSHSTLQYDFVAIRMPAPGEPHDSSSEPAVCDGQMTVCHVVRDPAHPTGLRSEPIAEVVRERLSRPASAASTAPEQAFPPFGQLA